MTVEQWLGTDNKLGQDIWNKKYRYKNETFEQWLDRVSNNNDELKKLILQKKFLFGGRALSNINTDNKSSLFNCYSRGFISDDLSDILQANTDIALTYKAQGGQGLSLSKLRPKGSPIGDRYSSDGIIPFMKMYNQTTSTISQGGSRKGALMISLDCRHKEVEDFITIKSNDTEISKANLSLEVDDEFMKAVEQFYKTGEQIVFHEKRNYNGHTIEYDIVPIKIYKLLCQTSYNWADPAILYTNRLRNYNLMEYVDGYEIETTNPCGEQPLPKNMCCNLGSLNLAEFVKNRFTDKAEFDFDDFKKSINIAVEALDNLVDKNAEFHALIEQKENSLNYRNIGLGVMGYANMLMMLGLTYGSTEAKEFTDKLFSFLFKQSVLASSNLAKEKGKFPKYSTDIWKSKIIISHFDNQEIETLKEHGLRNCSLISVAPTGSIATMLGRSGGCEPEFSISYKRKTESLNNGQDKYYDVFCKTAQEYINITNNKNLPKYFISSQQINVNDRIETQGIMQKHVDTAISSTVNLNNDVPVELVEHLYLYAWENGLKGITIYRDGCDRSGILTTENTNSQNKSKNTINSLKRGDIIEVNDDVIGKKRKLITGCGSLHCSAFFDPDTGDLMETYFSKGSQGGCNSFMVGLSRMISLAARSGCHITSIVDQLNSCVSCPSYAVRSAKFGDTSKGNCCPAAIGNALIDMWKEVKSEIDEDYNLPENHSQTKSISKSEIKKINSTNKCPECSGEAIFEGGCVTCKNCGWSRCG